MLSNSRARTKICGITRPEDALAAVSAGADAIGLVFYAPSPRSVTVDQAKEICTVLPPFVGVVALFVDAEPSLIHQVCKELPVTLLQFHGDESESDCQGYGVPYIKALRVRSSEDVTNAENNYPTATGILVDTYKAGVQGGTGETFDWDLLPVQRSKPLILAGGLTHQNVAKAIAHVQPYAVDVSGGVEASKGIKSSQLIQQFLQEVSCGSRS
ncbi:N-(5'-phosphoribosyl)anthranilate isomerase [Oleiphilus sp. HI0009]|uniref:phosphoribosylanthranilate isomerase n=1 Tax=unclassified Oleiphilus TaxID=2631174 RepID=UPI0007C35C97|nr:MULTISPECIES: phosphoribosylanthranilate isomerase [unclassified Oleiphilus]KZX74268.1 N-(5'-phosphoribosyl)anthranilate isomerase [Oleiphilus sp. HI0009]MCH2157638.1 phosphoribosylanthranilate isomerase [Oleiphilaceae bacterium]KZX76002.1 N-(5'-phosphoribosyl)anthranilate isomerase [Oleiphilus sp. HI0009]KZY65099.1 N-(5'-phosphoribosyl)anthranilate isomerase [Oleiphilus sp. HI0066]KZY71212.1 N-(5'-phosphoribosyl)anthranilate isomerase [Oleiphilus sp. HI0067]